jgi:shikimate kinase
MKIFLIGFMGCGKSSLGKRLANKLKLEFIDLDSEIEKLKLKSVSSIFFEEGEDKFRVYETEQLTKIYTLNNVVISTGGGTPCFNENMDLINKSGISIYIKMSSESLLHRLVNSKKERPLVKRMTYFELKKFISKKLTEREVYYNQANIIVKGEDLKLDYLVEQIWDFQTKRLFIKMTNS